MATFTQQLRRGLSRVPGGEPWPPAGAAGPVMDAPAGADDVAGVVETVGPGATAAAAVASEAVVAPAAAEPAAGPTAQPEPTAAAPAPAQAAAHTAAMALRRGLPRAPGGEPWPPAGAVAASAGTASTGTGHAAPAAESTAAATPAPATVAPSAAAAAASSAPAAAMPSATPGAATAETITAQTITAQTIEVELRRGLPRTPGGEPWPPAGIATVAAPAAAAAPAAEAAAPAPAPALAADATAAAARHAGTTETAATATAAATTQAAPSAPAHAEATPSAPSAETLSAETPAAEAPAAKPAAPAAKPAAPAKEPRLIRGRTIGQWVRYGVLGVLGLVVLAGIIVLAARGVTTLPGVPEFLERYPGEYHPAVPVDEGFPAWARWTHFLNFFFMVLIVRSGLLVRHQQQPPAFYTPKKGGKKVSIYLWLHTSLDVLWLINGVVFVVLLFVTGHWARIVPTSWEVFPNAASALLQYLTLEWPVENGWVNYNSLQQLMYFTIVFIAAPLAAITGVRMSEWWPKDAEKLNRFYPAPLARAIHYPTMLFFVLFVIVHVFLVFATGALQNLNHMFAGTDQVSWAGFWWFAAGFVVTVGAFAAARPLVLAPIAGVTGRISQR